MNNGPIVWLQRLMRYRAGDMWFYQSKSRGWKAQRRTYVLGLRKPAGVVKRELDEQRNIVKYGKDVADILKTLED